MIVRAAGIEGPGESTRHRIERPHDATWLADMLAIGNPAPEHHFPTRDRRRRGDEIVAFLDVTHARQQVDLAIVAEARTRPTRSRIDGQ